MSASWRIFGIEGSEAGDCRATFPDESLHLISMQHCGMACGRGATLCARKARWNRCVCISFGLRLQWSIVEKKSHLCCPGHIRISSFSFQEVFFIWTTFFGVRGRATTPPYFFFKNLGFQNQMKVDPQETTSYTLLPRSILTLRASVVREL